MNGLPPQRTRRVATEHGIDFLARSIGVSEPTQVRRRIVIVGGGFSGTLLAVHLLQQAISPIDIFLIERSQAIGRGLAYSTQNPGHLLNVRVANMSAFEGDPAHFLKWLWAKDLSDSPAAGIPPSGHAFVSRRVYGVYLEDVLKTACETNYSQAQVTIINCAAIGVGSNPDPFLTLDDGSIVPFDRMVLCVGNFPPGPVRGLESACLRSDRYIPDPWEVNRLERIGGDEEVLLVGAGLTAIDTIEYLAQKNHRGPIHVLSRHGLLPNRHEQTRSYSLSPDFPLWEISIRKLMRAVRSEIALGDATGYDWRSIFDALRPYTQRIWQRLPLEERARFLRHLRTYWDVHRHRMAPRVADKLTALREADQLKIVAGALIGAEPTRDGFEVVIRPRGAGEELRIDPRWIVNCSGPQCDYSRIADPLIQDLLTRDLVRRDALELGLDVADDNAVIGADGTISPSIFALGPPTKGAFWEITAVPDIRRACEALAERLAIFVDR